MNLKKRMPLICGVIALIILSFTVATVIQATSRADTCHKGCATKFPDSKALYDACMVGCAIP